MLLGEPQKIRTKSKTYTQNGVDESSHIEFEFSNKAKAESLISIKTPYANDAIIQCQNGSLTITNPWWGPRSMKVITPQKEFIIHKPYEGHGFCFEIAEVENCLSQNQIENESHSFSDTLATIKILDALRKDWGIIY